MVSFISITGLCWCPQRFETGFSTFVATSESLSKAVPTVKMTGRPLDHRQRNIECKAPGIICKERIEMPNSVNPIPDDYRGAIPYLNVNDGIGAAEFYKKAFGASERIR